MKLETGLQVESTATARNFGKLHLIRDGFVAEIIHGRATGLFHFIITREHSPEILCWGQEDSLDAARHCIDEFIVSENDRKKAA